MSTYRYKNPFEVYQRREVEEALLVTKSIGDDVLLTSALATYLPNSRCISVVRNGLAVADGWIRRGVKPEYAATAYSRFAREVFRQDRLLAHHLIVRFETASWTRSDSCSECVDSSGSILQKSTRFGSRQSR